MWDFNTIKQIIENLPDNHTTQNHALVVANKIMDVFRYDDPSSIAKARKVAEEIFGKGWEAKGEGIYKEGTRPLRVWGIGHCGCSLSHSVALVLTGDNSIYDRPHRHCLVHCFLALASERTTEPTCQLGYGPTTSLSRKWLDLGPPK